MDIVVSRCPYCGSTKISAAQPLVSNGAEELVKMGIVVPQIQQCKKCTATLNPKAFVVGSPDYKAAQAAKS